MPFYGNKTDKDSFFDVISPGTSDTYLLTGEPVTGSKLNSLAKAKDKKLESLKKTLLDDPFDDADSSAFMRIKGMDTPETYHEDDLHNERTKLFKQYSYLHPELTKQEATLEAEQQAEATKIAQEAGQDLPQMITDYRAQGIIDQDVAPTAFDIYQAGNEAVRYSDADKVAYPDTGKSASADFLTGEQGHFGRYLSDNKEYVDRMISEGYAIPGASGKELANQVKAMKVAEELGKGVYGTETGKKVMDAIYQTSSAKRYAEKGSTSKTTEEMLHYESPEKFQESVGEQLKYQVYRDENDSNKFYEFEMDSKGNFKTDAQGNPIRVPVPKEDVEALYIGKGKDQIGGEDVMKLGLASADLKPEFLEMWKEQGPEFVARYVDKNKINPYNYTYKYDGTPGPLGVDVEGGALMNVLMRKGRAKHLEKYVHTHAGQVRERAAGNVPLLTDAATSAKHDAKFGSGTSEYTLGSAPLWDVNYDMLRTEGINPAVLEEPMPSTNRQWKAIQKEWSKDKAMKEIADAIDSDGTFGEFLDGAQSSLISWYGKGMKGMVGAIQTVAETLGVDKNKAAKFLYENSTLDIFGGKRFEELAKQEVADTISGVKTSTRVEHQQAQKEAMKAIKDSQYGDAILTIIPTLPMLIADSAGETLSLMTLPTAMLTLAGRTSEQADTYKENNGKDPSAEWYMSSIVADATLMFGERLIIGKGIKDVVKKSGTGKKTKEFGKTMGFEAVQEAGETIKEEAFTQKGAFTDEAEKSLTEIATSPETQYAAMAAALSAGTLKATGETAIMAKDKVLETIGAKEFDLNEEKDRDTALADIKTVEDKEAFDLEIGSSIDLHKQNIEGLTIAKEALGTVKDFNTLKETIETSKELQDILALNETLSVHVASVLGAENVDTTSVKNTKELLLNSFDLAISDLQNRTDSLGKLQEDLANRVAQGKIVLGDTVAYNPVKDVKKTEETSSLLGDLDTIFKTSQSTITGVDEAVKNIGNLDLDTENKQTLFVSAIKDALLNSVVDADIKSKIQALGTVKAIENFTSTMDVTKFKDLEHLSVKDVEASKQREKGVLRRLANIATAVIPKSIFKPIRDKTKARQELRNRLSKLNNSGFSTLSDNLESAVTSMAKAFEGLDGYVILDTSDVRSLIEAEGEKRGLAKKARGKVKTAPKEEFEAEPGAVVSDIIAFVRDEVMAARKGEKDGKFASPISFKGKTFDSMEGVSEILNQVFQDNLSRASLATLESFKKAPKESKLTHLKVINAGSKLSNEEASLKTYDDLIDSIIETKHAGGRGNIAALKNRVVYAINNSETLTHVTQVSAVEKELDFLYNDKKAITKEMYDKLKDKLKKVKLEQKKKFEADEALSAEQFKEVLDAFNKSNLVPDEAKEVMQDADEKTQKELLGKSTFTAASMERLAYEFLISVDNGFVEDKGLEEFIKKVKARQDEISC